MKAAKDLWDVLQPDVAIKASWSDEVLKEKVIEAAKCLEAGDELEAETIVLLKELEVDMAAGIITKGGEVAKKAEVKKAEVKKPPVEAGPKIVSEKKAKIDVKKTGKDVYGCNIGSKTSEAIALLAPGKYTMSQAKKQAGVTCYGALDSAKTVGFIVEKRVDGTFKIEKA
jgi:hypothetical protein